MSRIHWILPFLVATVFAEEKEESPQVKPSVLFTSDVKKDAGEKPKPHFAGAKRSAVEGKKKAKKAKNPWFLSKTYPKKPKPQVVEEEAEFNEETPYFIRVEGE